MSETLDRALLDPLAEARKVILRPAGLDEAGIERALGVLLGAEIDGGDLYFQASREEHWTLEDSTVKDGSHSIESGVGVRALAGERTGFAYSDEIIPEALLQAARTARAIAHNGRAAGIQAWKRVSGHSLYLPVDPIDTRHRSARAAGGREPGRGARGDTGGRHRRHAGR